MTKPLIYVAGPITGDPWQCVRKAINVAAALRDNAGMLAYLPQLSVLHEMISPEPYEHWIEHGLAMVERCDGVYRIPGDSPGADREVAHAMELGIPVYVASPHGQFPLFAEAVRMRMEARR